MHKRASKNPESDAAKYLVVDGFFNLVFVIAIYDNIYNYDCTGN